jgi:uncharacterized RDD family membrane protein YckC
MELRDVLFFDKMIVPRIIQVLYWILVVVVLLSGIVTMFQSALAGLGLIILGPLFVRIYCELMIVAFKINESLQVIRDK